MSPEFIAQLHPKIVHFPIALLFTYTLLEALGAIFRKDLFSKAAAIVLTLGVFGAIAALFTGGQALDYANVVDASDIGPVPMKHLTEHAEWADITVWFFAGVLVLRVLYILFVDIKKKFPQLLHTAKYGFTILAIVGCYFVFRTGEAGGEEVYKTSLIKKLNDYEKAIKDSVAEKAAADSLAKFPKSADTLSFTSPKEKK